MPGFNITFRSKSKSATVPTVAVHVAKAKDEDSAITAARQHALMSVSRWNVEKVEKV